MTNNEVEALCERLEQPSDQQGQWEGHTRFVNPDGREAASALRALQFEKDRLTSLLKVAGEALKPFALLNLNPPDPIERYDEESPIYIHLPHGRRKVVPVVRLIVGHVQRARTAHSLISTWKEEGRG